MRVRMLQAQRGSPDGINVFEYKAGEKYELPDELAMIFLKYGWAEEDKELIIEKKKKSKKEIDDGAA